VLAAGQSAYAVGSAGATTATPQENSSGASVTGAPPAGGFDSLRSVPAMFATCVAVAQRAAGGTDTRAVVATAIYGHIPALVVVPLAGTGPTATPGPLVVVVARSDCRVLARTTP
jgi:hypothetical protein